MASRDRFVAGYIEGLGATARQGSASTPESNVDSWTEGAGRLFDEHADEHPGYWPRAIAELDLDTLVRAGNARGLKELTNERIAHFSPQQKLAAQRLSRDIHDCIAVLHRISRRYEFLLLQEDRPALSSSIDSMLNEGVRRFWLGDGIADESASPLD